MLSSPLAFILSQDRTLRFIRKFTNFIFFLFTISINPVSLSSITLFLWRIGSSTSGFTRLSIYSSLNEAARSEGDPSVRLEIRLGSTRSLISKIKKQGLEFAKFQLFKDQLFNLVETPLLEKHRAFIESQELAPAETPVSAVPWTAVIPESTVKTSVEWFKSSCIPAIKKLLNSDVAEEVRQALTELLESEGIFEKVEQKEI